jgi:hypothetical protein
MVMIASGSASRAVTKRFLTFVQQYVAAEDRALVGFVETVLPQGMSAGDDRDADEVIGRRRRRD